MTDVEFTKTLLKDIEVGSTQKKSNALVEKSKTKYDPSKMFLPTNRKKEKVLTNLKNLDDKQFYKGISVKEDHTHNERNIIREFSKQAQEENSTP